MSLVKLAFLGIHYRKLGPKEKEKAIANHEKYDKLLNSNTAKGISTGLFAGVGTLGGHLTNDYLKFTGKNMTPTKKALSIAAGTVLGGGLGYLDNRSMAHQNKSKIERFKDPNAKWITFRKKSKLDNE